MNGDIGKLERGQYEDLTLKQLYDDFGGKVSLEECMRLLASMQREEVWLCPEYQVALDKSPQHGFKGLVCWHLSIKRTPGAGRGPVHDWRDLMEIKNQLCGPECEAIELYPAESRKVDSADQYHLLAFIKDRRRKFPRVPWGWQQRYVVDDPRITGSQRRLKEGETQTDPFVLPKEQGDDKTKT